MVVVVGVKDYRTDKPVTLYAHDGTYEIKCAVCGRVFQNEEHGYLVYNDKGLCYFLCEDCRSYRGKRLPSLKSESHVIGIGSVIILTDNAQWSRLFEEWKERNIIKNVWHGAIVR